MADRTHSKQQLEAAEAQSKADHQGGLPEEVREMQSKADQAAVKKHGL